MTPVGSEKAFSPSENATVLLVDDEPYLLEEMSEVLETEGYQCLTARDANEAFEIVKAEDLVDLVVTDIRMPGIDGLEFIRELKNKSRREQNLAMIVLSGHAGFNEAVGAMRAGAEDFLTKPVSSEDLLASVERALNFTAQRRVESSFRENLASESSNKERTVIQLQDTLKGKNRYIDALESACRNSLTHSQQFCAIGHVIMAGLAHDISAAHSDQPHPEKIDEIRDTVSTLSLCSSLGQGARATDLLLGMTKLTDCRDILLEVLDRELSVLGLILTAEADPSERPTGGATLDFLSGTCAAMIYAAKKAKDSSRIFLELGWNGQQPSASITYTGEACSSEELKYARQNHMPNYYGTGMDPSFYIAVRLLSDARMNIQYEPTEINQHRLVIKRRTFSQ